jgi:uncharacterized protein (DUF952 family)
MNDHSIKIYHMCRKEEWEQALKKGNYSGSSQDRKDGFIHFSSKEQIVASAAKHRAGQSDILLLTVHQCSLGNALKWEKSRGGDLFPHLYGDLPISLVTSVTPLPLGKDGKHIFPETF